MKYIKTFLHYLKVTTIIILLCPGLSNRQQSYQKHDETKLQKYRQRVVEMFQHAYDGYVKYAYPYDELRPLTCDGHDTWGSFSLTLIDALDTLAVMGNATEFRRVAKLIVEQADFDKDVNVSVFETNIRVVGGLLSAHLLSRKMGVATEPGWPCTGPLLSLAETVARKLLPAFRTPTGMPYGTVNLRHGVPVGETSVTCTACVGTYIIEFSTLTRLTGDPVFEDTASNALEMLWRSRSNLDLVGNHIDVKTGKWTALDSGIGGGIDSYFEYLVKAAVMLGRSDLLEMFRTYEAALEKLTKRDDWYMVAHMTKGEITQPLFQSLEAFWPGVQSLLGDIEKGMATIHNYHQVWQQLGFTPEMYNIVWSTTHAARDGYPLRPELAESAMYLYRATGDPYLLEVGYDIVDSINDITVTSCGFATVKNVNTHMLENRMESFFLSETTKYLYLLFTPDHFIHNTGEHGTVIKTPRGKCVIDSGGYVFNTEAHPIDMAAVHCCSAHKKRDDSSLQDLHDNLDLLTLFGVVDPVNDKFAGVRLRDATGLRDADRVARKADGFDFQTAFTDLADKVRKSTMRFADMLLENAENTTANGDESRMKDDQESDNEERKGEKPEENSDLRYDNDEIIRADDSPEIDTIKPDGLSRQGAEIRDEKDTIKPDAPVDVTEEENQSENIEEVRLDGLNLDVLSNKSMSFELLDAMKTPVEGQPDQEIEHTKQMSVIDELKKIFGQTADIGSAGLSLSGSTRKVSVESIAPSKPELMSCRALPYYMKYSWMGEMAPTNSE